MKKLIVLLIALSILCIGNADSFQSHDRSRNIVNPATSDKQSDGSQTIKLVNNDNVAYSSDPKLTACVGEQVALSRITYINKFGFNSDVDAASDPEDSWDGGGLWVPPTEARTHNIASTDGDDGGTVQSTGTVTRGTTTKLVDTNATFVSDGVIAGDAVLNDTNIDHSIVISATETTLTFEPTHHTAFTGSVGFNSGDTYRVVTTASTGASIVHLYGLDSNMDEKEEFIVLNGASNVATMRTYWRIYRMHLDGAADRTVNNEGTITVTAAVDGTVTSQMNIGNGQTLGTPYTIPNGKIGCMVLFSATAYKSAVGALVQMTLRQTKFAGPDGAGSIVEHYFSLATDGSSHIHHGFGPYKRFEQRTDIWQRAETASSDNVAVSGAFDIILVDMN